MRASSRPNCLKEIFQQFWLISDPTVAEPRFRQWMRAAKCGHLQAFKLFVQLLESHLEEILAWSRLRLSDGALEGMNNKIKLISSGNELPCTFSSSLTAARQRRFLKAEATRHLDERRRRPGQKTRVATDQHHVRH